MLDDEIDEIDELEFEDDFELNRLKEKRMEELRREVQMVEAMKSTHHGQYLEIYNEKELLQITVNEEMCVVHFYHKEFRRCKIMDKHLKILAERHFKTRFVRINVDNSPFLVARLQIQVLPCVVMFLNSVSVDRIIGFDEIGGSDGFETTALEKRMIAAGVIVPERPTINGIKSSVFNRAVRDKKVDTDSDDD